MRRSVAVVGGGAAGIFAALGAAKSDADVVLIERNRRIGIKILISGGGRCNITHDATTDELEGGFIDREARFLRYAFNVMPPTEVLRMLHAEGLATMTRPNGRVFPATGTADDVLSAFERMLDKAGVVVRTNTLVSGIQIEGDVAIGVAFGHHVERYDATVVATGGMSYRKVGTTGDGIRWCAGLGVGIEPVRAALAPVYFPSPPPVDWQGVALRDVLVWLETADGRRPKFPRPTASATQWRGDLLLTHRGASGPTILEISRAAELMRERGDDVLVCVDLLPDVSIEDLRALWDARLRSAPRSEIQTFVETFMPRALVPYFLRFAEVPTGTKLAETDRAGRLSVLGALKRWPIGRVGEIPIDRGEVTAGGVVLAAVSPRTMSLRAVDGLYVAGEALDVAGCVGGYNLQAAFSTGWIAGRSAALGET